jgi:hypothetical protein
VPEVERLQHATAADLESHRYGTAWLAKVATDPSAPIARRYRAFFLLAERHPAPDWPLFRRYLDPHAHHAFVGAAAEAARYYAGEGATEDLLMLFEDIRSDVHLRTFLSPRILESLFVLSDPGTLSLFRSLLVAGHTAPAAERCEVMRSLVMVRRFTGSVEPNIKFPDPDDASVREALDAAEAGFERQRDVLIPVAVI